MKFQKIKVIKARVIKNKINIYNNNLKSAGKNK